MSNTSDYNLANQVGSSFRAELNTVLGDVQSLNSGSSDPTTTVAYKIWVDTSTNLLKIRNSSNNGWLVLGSLTDAAHTNNFGLATKADPDFTGTVDSAGDIVMAGTGALKLPSGTTAQRPTAATGQIRFNNTTTEFEGYNGSAWGGLASGVPVGTILAHAANTPPTGFLECNGSNISRSTYATLFSTISTTFGVGDGSSTFALPDLRGQFIRGWANTGSTDASRVFGSTQTDQNKNHTHTTDSTTLTGGIRKISEGFLAGGSATGVFTKTSDGNNSITGSSSTSPVGGVDFDGTHTHTISSSGGGTEARPTNLALMYIIKF
jgi:microcystin-dependent protein